MYTKRSGNKQAFICVILLFVSCLFLTGCPGIADWTSDLPNDYCVTHVNNRDIIFSKFDVANGGYTEPTIERFIISYCYSESHIGLKRFPLMMYPESGPREEAFFGSDLNNLEYNYVESDLEFYLIDAYQDKVYGPFNAAEYDTKCEELGVEEMCDWISTIS